MHVLFVASRIRVEEKLLLEELARRPSVRVTRWDDDEVVLPLSPAPRGVVQADVVLMRSISYGRTLASLAVLEAQGTPCVNRLAVVETCGDKLRTHVALERHGVPVPRASVAYSEQAALEAIEAIGYPAVLKPVVGSWGRLVSRVNDRHAAEAVLEHRAVLGSWQDHVYYVQELVDKPGRDLRAFVIGGRCVAAIYRTSEHWITNTARGGIASRCPPEGEVARVAEAAAAAVGGGIVAVDLAETRDGRLLVLECNHTTEFRNSIATTGVDLPARIVDHVLEVGRAGRASPAAAASPLAAGSVA